MRDLASAIVGLLLLGLLAFGAVSLVGGLRHFKGRAAAGPAPLEEAVLPPGDEGTLAEVRRSAAVLEEELGYSAGTVAELLANPTFAKAVDALRETWNRVSRPPGARP